MRYTPCVYPKNWCREITTRRLSAASRFAQREKDKVALFPELVASVEAPIDRLKAFQEGERLSSTEKRQERAAAWRAVRRRYFALEEHQRRGLARFWAQCGHPGAPEYLAVMVSEAERGVSFWGKLRELRQLQLIAARRLVTDQPIFNRECFTAPWRWRSIYDRDIARFRQKRAAKIARKNCRRKNPNQISPRHA